MPIDQKYGRVTLERQRNIGNDEPVIVFRAQDRLLPKLLKVYRYLCELAGSPENHLEAIDHTAKVIKTWQAEHPTKTPTSTGYEPPRDDTDHETPHG
jgi:hypothetical protein